MEWLRKLFEQIKTLWGNWKPAQRIILLSIGAAVILGLVLLISLSARPSRAELFSRPITDVTQLDRILNRLDQEGFQYTVTETGWIYMDDEREARQATAILFREDLVPPETSPWDLFDVERWTATNFERNVNLQRALTSQLELHIEALEDVDNASVTIAFPEDEIFLEDQNPVTVSAIISPRPGSDIRENRHKVEGLERLIQFAIEGLASENITITDTSGVVLNDFENLDDFDRLARTEREMKIQNEEAEKIRRAILDGISGILSKNRVRIPDVDVTVDWNEQSITEREVFPISVREDNPLTPQDETQTELSVPVSEVTAEETFRGTGFNPEGPPGAEGQTPSAYQDLQDTVGNWENRSVETNYEINQRESRIEVRPSVGRRTIGIAIDGVWRKQYLEDGTLDIAQDGRINREYIPPTQELLDSIEAVVRDAIGFDASRGDSVTVEHIQFDRSEEHEAEDAAARRQRQIQQIVLYSLIGVAVLLVAFIAFRLISREVERRRRLREEELARQHQAMREAALRSAEEEGTEVEMSVEERARLEMQENAVNMAREHPEDVAQLIRTWLMEE